MFLLTWHAVKVRTFHNSTSIAPEYKFIDFSKQVDNLHLKLLYCGPSPTLPPSPFTHKGL